MGITITFDSLEQFHKVFESTLSRGGAFAPGEIGYTEAQEFDVTFVHPVSRVELVMHARAVWVVPEASGGGVGIEIIDFTPQTREQLAAWIEEHNYPPPPEPEKKPERVRNAINVHERLRNLTMAEQVKVARDGDVNERTVLERIYGKHVWEALVRNPRLTAPEVTRIARMVSVPRPLLEQIVGNAAWMASPQVRRALLTNRRLAGDMVQKVLRATPKNELKLMHKQTAYPPSVRAAAKKLLPG